MATSTDIRAQIGSIDHRLAELEADAADLALDAVNGDADAASRVAEINREQGRLRADRRILETAYRTAQDREHAAKEAARAAEREKHLSAAREHAEALRAAAARADSLVDALREVMAGMDAHERAIRVELSAAGVTPPGAVPGRQGLSGHVLMMLKAMADAPTGRLRDQRCAADLAVVAWKFLETEAEEAA